MRVAEVIDHTRWIRELIIEPVEPETFQFRAGQFVMLHVPTTSKPALRAYSIASDDRNQRRYHLIFKWVDNGIASTYVWQLKGGEVLDFTGPFGRLFFLEPPTDQVVFLNTGSGVSQHVCYLQSKGHLYPKTKFRMLIGLREASDIYYVETLEALKKSLPSFTYDFVLSSPPPQWTGLTRYVQDHIAEFNYTQVPTTFYLCGNGEMIKQTKKLLIEERGLDKNLVLAEAFD